MFLISQNERGSSVRLHVHVSKSMSARDSKDRKSTLNNTIHRTDLGVRDRGEKDSSTLLIPSIEGSTSSAKVLMSLLRILRK